MRSTDANLIAALTPGPWVPLGFASGFSAAAGCYPPAYRIWRDTIQLRGAVAGTFAAATNTTPFGAWPAAATPAEIATVLLAATFASNSCSGRLTLTSSSTATVVCAQAATTVSLDSCSYSLV